MSKSGLIDDFNAWQAEQPPAPPEKKGSGRPLTDAQKEAMAEGRRRKAAENAEQARPPSDPKLGDAYVDSRCRRITEASGIEVGMQVRITKGKHRGEVHTVQAVKTSEAEVFDGRRWWDIERCEVVP